jgi:glycosyltransferase involved in cell wall biosynthesis
VVLDLWEPRAAREGAAFTTVATWQNVTKDVTFGGETYYWSKHVNFLRFLELPRLTPQPLELALDASCRTRAKLRRHGWRLASAYDKSRDVTAYRDYVLASRGEFTVAKDLMARPRSGWFSDRSVAYLAAGKPVVTQETGFSKFVPTGCGLFAVDTPQQAAAAIAEINADYRRHARGAREVAAECFASDRVLRDLCREAGL